MKEQLMKILTELRPDVDFENETALISDGILDSFDIVSLIGEINQEFDVSIGADDIEPENLDSVSAMLDLINELAD